MFSQFNYWEFLAGLGIFLFGIFLLEESIKILSGAAFKKLIRKYTATNIRAIGTGAFATAILQSSTAVSMMVLAFVGAGILSISNGIGVVIGSSLGTTMTSWIVASVGFKVDISSISLPFIGIGGLGLIFFGNSGKATNISKLLVGFGFLFMGLDYMKSSIEEFAKVFDITTLNNTSTFTFLIFGIVLTALIQSSSATMAIALSSIHTGLITFEMAAATVIGASIGTTATVFLGAIGGVPAKKQVAYSHFFFNLTAACIAFALLPVLIYLIRDIMGFREEVVIALALFHSLFVFIGIIIFVPFISQFAKFIMWIAPNKKDDEAIYLSPSSVEVPEAAIESLSKETLRMIRMSMLHNLLVMKIDPKLIFSQNQLPINGSIKNGSLALYDKIKLLQDEMFSYISQIQNQVMTSEESERIARLIHSIRNAVIAAKTIKDIKKDLESLEGADSDFLNNKYDEFRKKLMNMYVAIEQILTESSETQLVSSLFQIARRNYYEDKTYLANITTAIANKQVPQGSISAVLTINRGFVFSYNQLINSIRDLRLDEEQAEIFDNLSLKDNGEN